MTPVDQTCEPSGPKAKCTWGTLQKGVGVLETLLLEVRNLCVKRGNTSVLAGVNLEVKRGQRVCVRGDSGCGKSTLLRALARLEHTSGQIWLDGLDASTLDTTVYRHRVSLVFQEPPMFEGTVRDNITFGPALRGKLMSDRSVRDLLAQLCLDRGIADRSAEGLSGGERQRVALARALANQPDVLLLDEPTSALDPSVTDQVLRELSRRSREGLSIVAVLHIASQAYAFADRLYSMREGRLWGDSEA